MMMNNWMGSDLTNTSVRNTYKDDYEATLKELDNQYQISLKPKRYVASGRRLNYLQVSLSLGRHIKKSSLMKGEAIREISFSESLSR